MLPEQVEVLVRLLDERVDVWRPVSAEMVDPGHYRLRRPVPDEELWEFQPGEVVRCEIRQFSGGFRGLTAIDRRDI